MSSIARRLSARAVSPRLSLCIDSASIAATAAVMMREMTAAQLAYFKGVESIHLKGEYYPADDVRSVIAQMIALSSMSRSRPPTECFPPLLSHIS
jgi:hypothetical protein